MSECSTQVSADNLHRVSKKTVQNCFLSELRQISTNFDNFWQKDGKEVFFVTRCIIYTSTDNHQLFFAPRENTQKLTL